MYTACHLLRVLTVKSMSKITNKLCDHNYAIKTKMSSFKL